MNWKIETTKCSIISSTKFQKYRSRNLNGKRDVSMGNQNENERMIKAGLMF